MTNSNIEMLPPGTNIGILGGGQLGRMLALSAAQLGMKTTIYCPDPISPAFDVTPNKFVAAYEDEVQLTAFAQSVDIITYEFENLPVSAIELLAKIRPVAPGANALAIAQDRVAEKHFLGTRDIPIAPYQAVQTLEELHKAIETISLPAVLKTARLGYDGKGQRILRDAKDVEAAFAALGGPQLVLEAFIPFEREISVVVARNARGEVRDYDPSENVHENHILKTSTLPANIDVATAQNAGAMARKIAEELDYIGILAIEFFVVNAEGQTRLLVNEIAPRVHNSGHWTQAACLTSQFEQHIRAICNWPLGDPARHLDIVMENLIGDEINSAPKELAAGAQLHIYGKAEARVGRKMGHLNRLTTKIGTK